MAIQHENPALLASLKSLLSSETDFVKTDVKLTDFDGCLYLIKGLDSNRLSVSIYSPNLDSVSQAGGLAALQRNYSNFESSTSPNTFALTVERTNSDDPAEKQNLANQVACQLSILRVVLMSGPFLQALEGLRNNSVAPAEVLLRKNEYLWVVPGESRVSFVFEINFLDSTDSSFAKVFVQEFVEAKRQVPNSPLVTFSPNSPEYIRSFPNSGRKPSVGFLSFTVLKEHSKDPEQCARQLCCFRQYLNYHIHACKTYLHMRMRKRTDVLLEVLKEAVPESIEAKSFKRVRATQTRREESKIVHSLS